MINDGIWVFDSRIYMCGFPCLLVNLFDVKLNHFIPDS